MKKFYKRVNSKRFTIENMATCLDTCYIGCVYCGDACGTNVATGAALIGTGRINGRPQEALMANGRV